MSRWFAACALLAVPMTCLAQNEITFSVDMTRPMRKGFLSPCSGDRALVRGTMNEWAGDDLELADPDGDSTYSAVAFLEGENGTEIEYKYVILRADGAVLWEWDPDPDNPPYGNRRLELGGVPQSPPRGTFQMDKYDLHRVGEKVEFSVDELHHDFRQMRDALENSHCCPYEYTKKHSLDSLFERQYEMIDRPMAPDEFFRILTPITAKIGCGHTTVWMPGRFWDLGPDHLFPLRIRLIEGRAVAAGSYTGSDQVAFGSILTKINGRPVEEIIEELRVNYSADAFNDHFRLTQIERRFPMLYARVYGFTDEYTVSYLAPEEEVESSAGLEPADIGAVRAAVFPEPVLNLQILPEYGTALLTIESFSYYDRVPMFKTFIDSCFQQIREREIGRLILDLRANDGGDPFCAVPLFSYLELEPVPYFAARYGKYSEFADPIPVAARRFEGELYTLVDGRCFSTNGHFCSLLQYHGIGVLVGGDTGASFCCNADVRKIRLDNTRILLHVPRGSFATAVKGMDKSLPIAPDFRVEQSYRDFVAGRDSVLEFALDRIREERRP